MPAELKLVPESTEPASIMEQPKPKKTDILFLPLIWLTPRWVSPNQLSYIRIGMIVPIIILILLGYCKTAGILLIIAAIIDGLDGALARHRGECSPFGAILDPTADKLLNAATYLGLYSNIDAVAFGWLIMPIIIIDAWLFLVASAKYVIKYVLPTIKLDHWAYEAFKIKLILENVRVDKTGANWAGKTKMVLQVVSLSELLLFDYAMSIKIHEYLTFLPHLRLLECSYPLLVLCTIFGGLSLWGHIKVIHRVTA